MTQLKSQILGLSLGLITAIGCIFYEKLVEIFSFRFMILIYLIEALIMTCIAWYFFKSDLSIDIKKVSSNSKYIVWCVIYIATISGTIFWYFITRHQGVMATSVYEVKYIVMLAIIYILFGDNKFTINTAIGVLFALISIYFISKT